MKNYEQGYIPVKHIVACTKTGLIGKNGKLVYECKEDLRRFKELTKGDVVVMGRKTFESIGHPLPDRFNVVITRDKNWFNPYVTIENDISTALPKSQWWAQHVGAKNVWIIGGGEIYASTMCAVDEVDLTVFDDTTTGGDTFYDLDKLGSLWFEFDMTEQFPETADNPAYTRYRYHRGFKN